MAREMHDVVAHRLSLLAAMRAHSSTGPTRLPTNSPVPRASFSPACTGHSKTRREVIGVLRDGDLDDSPAAGCSRPLPSQVAATTPGPGSTTIGET
jgi:hypothetical protein